MCQVTCWRNICQNTATIKGSLSNGELVSELVVVRHRAFDAHVLNIPVLFIHFCTYFPSRGRRR